jgi:hypothetical protein
MVIAAALVQTPNVLVGIMARMTRAAPEFDLFKGRHFDREVIVLCVRWYLSFKLSSRDLVQMMNERGIILAHTTIFALGATLRA